MQKLKWRRRRRKRLQGEMQHHRTVLANRIEHDWPFALGNGLTEDLNALGLKALKMGKRCHAVTFSLMAGRERDSQPFRQDW
jgi:hypothetical protein